MLLYAFINIRSVNYFENILRLVLSFVIEIILYENYMRKQECNLLSNYDVLAKKSKSKSTNY